MFGKIIRCVSNSPCGILLVIIVISVIANEIHQDSELLSAFAWIWERNGFPSKNLINICTESRIPFIDKVGWFKNDTSLLIGKQNKNVWTLPFSNKWALTKMVFV